MLQPAGKTQEVLIPVERVNLLGDLFLPEQTTGIVLFAHGSGSSRYSPRNQFVAQVIRDAGVGTLLFDLLTREEEAIDAHTRRLRFDIQLLKHRLLGATHWIRNQAETKDLKMGFFGASTGAAAALMAAAELGEKVSAVVSRGGRPDLAGALLARVTAPTLLLVGGCDEVVLQLNEEAYEKLQCQKELVVIPGATHLFEERGALEEVAQTAAHWFHHYL